ncbi:MAG: tetratricopeptide repeat protein, partial [Acidobacteriota bacterium]
MAKISLPQLFARLALFLLLLGGGLAVGQRIVMTALGDSFASYVERTPNLSTVAQLEAMDLAARYAPFDPLIRLRRGGRYIAAATEEGNEEWGGRAVAEIRLATTLAPTDYRIWLALGRALDRVGNATEARSAYERSLQLAPNYFETHWAFANHLLRSGDRDASFLLMRRALALRPAAFALIFDYAWEAYDGQVAEVLAALAPPPAIQAQMATLLVRRNQPAPALEIWRQIPAPTPPEVREFALSLLQAARPAEAWQIWSAAALPDTEPGDPDSLLANGGFERRILRNNRLPFRAWQINPHNGVRVTVDRQDPDDGAQSLRVSFSLENNEPLTVFTQVVPVTPGRDYCLSFSLRTEELKSLSLPKIELFDTANPARAYVATPPLPGELANWTDQSLRIRAASSTQSLSLRLQRPPCADPFCSIEGR